MKSNTTTVRCVILSLSLASAVGCNRDTSPAVENPSGTGGAADGSGGTAASAVEMKGLSIEEKKSLRKANEEIAEAAGTLREAGVQVEVVLEPGVVNGYDFEALGQEKKEVLGRLGYVPVRILGAIATLAEDADYKEALQGVRTIRFVPSEVPNDSGFDYGSVAMSGSTMTVTYAPMGSMHGGMSGRSRGSFRSWGWGASEPERVVHATDCPVSRTHRGELASRSVDMTLG